MLALRAPAQVSSPGRAQPKDLTTVKGLTEVKSKPKGEGLGVRSDRRNRALHVAAPVKRQPEAEHAPDARLALHDDVPAMRQRDVTHQRQTEAQPLDAAFD